MICTGVKNKYLRAICKIGCYSLKISMEKYVFVMHFGHDKIGSNLFTRNY